MPTKPFDTSLKDVVERHPMDWVRLLSSWPVTEVQVLDAETSAVTSAADKVIQVDGSSDNPWILHPEFVSAYKSTFPRQLWWYNSVLHQRHNLPVVSVAMLLRRQADGPLMTGRYTVKAPHEAEPYNVTNYRIERLWQWPAERLLTGGIGALPLAPLTDESANSLPGVIARIDRRLETEATHEQREHLLAATSLLMGLRHPWDQIQDAMKGASNMWNSVLEDSSVVQHWLARAKEEGKAEECRRLLIRQGNAKFGPSDAESAAQIESTSDLEKLEQLSIRLLTSSSWQELLSG